MTKNDWLQVYQQYPNVLAQELGAVLEIVHGPAAEAAHNNIANRIQILCPDRNKLLQNVAAAVIASATSEEPQ